MDLPFLIECRAGGSPFRSSRRQEALIEFRTPHSAFRTPLPFFPARVGLLCLLMAFAHAHAGAPVAWVTTWMSAQTNLLTWSADVLQTRSLKTLAQPLQARGQVWFAAPNRFRWELVEPSATIAVRQADQLMVIYPRLKRAERYPLSGTEGGPWKDALSLLEAGFPRSQAELETRFRVLSQSVTGEVCEIALQPKASSARRLMPQIKIAFATNDLTLRATELQFADGSTIRNDFSHSQLNPRLDDSLFTPKLDADFKIVEPMKR
jgi:outer membrane lipoprotein-sorting protein